MSTTIDHLRVDHRITVLRDFTDAAGVSLRAGEGGILRVIAFDQLRLEIRLEIEREGGRVALCFPLQARTGPRNGHMRDFFELGENVSIPRVRPAPERPPRTMIIPPPAKESPQDSGPEWWREARELEAAGRLEAAEAAIQQAVQHIGAAASIAEMHARRMRQFQRAGDEANAVAAFKRAVDWMGTYASWATSGGEGAALSDERDRFHAALVREFGYDPTESGA
jgi:hypothetical protein